LGLTTELFDALVIPASSDPLYHTFLIITSEKSCCGKLNSDVLGVSKGVIHSYIENNKIVSLICIGWKGKSGLLSKFKSDVGISISFCNKVSYFLSYLVVLCILDTTFERCHVYFSKYYKIFEQAPAFYDFVSFDDFFLNLYRNSKENVFFDFLLNSDFFSLRNLYIYNICLIVLDALDENKYSELGSRAFSMEMAHRNAIELIVEKMLIYNKVRQACITKDLLEVVSGAIYSE
jgi:ATP synthase F1 gamma subunit